MPFGRQYQAVEAHTPLVGRELAREQKSYVLLRHAVCDWEGEYLY